MSSEINKSVNTAVILINYNTTEDTLECIQSLQESGIPVFIVIVENGSAEKDLEPAISDYKNLHLIDLKENVGFGRANNLAIEWVLKNTKYDFIFILNNDTTIERNTIGLMQKELEANEEVGMATCKILMMHDKSTIWYGGGEFNPKTGKVKALYGKPVTTAEANKNKYVSFASGCAMLFKRQTLEIVRGFDKRFFLYIEDVEICLRVLKEGWKILYVHEGIVYHKCQGSARGRETKFVPRLNVNNKNLPFHVYHTFKNQFITNMTYIRGINRLYFFMSFYSYWIPKFLQLLLYTRLNACKAMLKAQRDALAEGSL